jgi:hypothetical protein
MTNELTADLTASDFAAFALDLDSDGLDEIVFVASSVERVSEEYEKAGGAHPYSVRAGILANDSAFPTIFFGEQGEYSGGTDAIGHAGIVPIAPKTGEIALLVRSGEALSPSQQLVRYRKGRMQRIETIEFRCH